MVAGLLFLAFAFFAVGQAAATRNGAQGAADSAALAAAQRAREELRPKILAALVTPGGFDNIFEGGTFIAPARAEASGFAARNHADLLPGGWSAGPGATGQFKFTVKVRTQYTVGKSVIPGTDEKHATASATAVLKLRCDLPPGGVAGQPTVLPTAQPTAQPSGEPTGQPTAPPVTMTCDGQDVPTDPLPPLEMIFSVGLVN